MARVVVVAAVAAPSLVVVAVAAAPAAAAAAPAATIAAAIVVSHLLVEADCHEVCFVLYHLKFPKGPKMNYNRFFVLVLASSPSLSSRLSEEFVVSSPPLSPPLFPGPKLAPSPPILMKC